MAGRAGVRAQSTYSDIAHTDPPGWVFLQEPLQKVNQVGILIRGNGQLLVANGLVHLENIGAVERQLAVFETEE